MFHGPSARGSSAPLTNVTSAVTEPHGLGGGRDSWDEAIYALASRQHGIVARHQLREAGLSASAIRHRIARDRLHEIYPGVYAVGHRILSARGWWMAAVLTAGRGAVLSHRAAAALWGLVEHAPSTVDVLVLRSTEHRRGLRPHRVRSIVDEDRTIVDGIPCTSVARTLLDLATMEDERVLDRALRKAEHHRIFDRFALESILQRGRPGTPVLRTAMLVFAGDEATRRRLNGELELRFIELLKRHGFVLPSTNVTISTPWRDWEVDTFWPGERQVIELDGWWTHNDRTSFNLDHARATDVRAAGYFVTRLTWDQVVSQEAATVERLMRFIPRLGAGETEPQDP